ARQGAPITVPGELCRVLGDIADDFVFRLCSLRQLLPRSLFDQVSHRILAHHPGGYRAVFILPCAFDEDRIFGPEAGKPLPREWTDAPSCSAHGSVCAHDYCRSARHRNLCGSTVYQLLVKSDFVAPWDWEDIKLIAFDVDGTLYWQRPIRLRMAREM